MTVQHHPSDATLLAHAAGSLNGGFSLVVESHLALCPACSAVVPEAEAIGGELLEALTPAALDPRAQARILARLGEPALVRPAPSAGVADPLIPSPLRAYIDRPLAGLPWCWLGPGIRQVRLEPWGGAVHLLRVEPGRAMPRHGHNDTELTLILSGSYTDEFGTFARGDVAELDPDDTHRPMIEPGVPCLCLIATNAPLRFEGLIARIAQRFLGI